MLRTQDYCCACIIASIARLPCAARPCVLPHNRRGTPARRDHPTVIGLVAS